MWWLHMYFGTFDGIYFPVPNPVLLLKWPRGLCRVGPYPRCPGSQLNGAVVCVYFVAPWLHPSPASTLFLFLPEKCLCFGD